jgi:hypothetical protein
MKVVEYLLELSGIGRDRLCLKWVSAAEGQLFSEYVAHFSQQTQALGPFDPGQYMAQLEAIEFALTSRRLRWLIGMDIHLTEKGNVFDRKISREDYHKLLEQAAREEYYGALILGILKGGPVSVKQIAFQTGLPVYTVSLRLGELERRHQAEVRCYDGTTPKFITLAA